MSAEDRADKKFLQAGDEHNGLIDRMEEMTNDLMRAIDSWDVDRALDLIESRSQLCNRIGVSIQRLASLEPGQRQNASAAVSALLDSAIQRIHERQQQMMDQQAKAEQAMAAELRRRRPALAEMNSRRAHQSAYHKGSSASRYGRFLDSKT